MSPAAFTFHILRRLLADPYLRTTEAAFILAAIMAPGSTRPELQTALGYSSAEQAGYILRHLCAAGYLKRAEGKPRTSTNTPYHRYLATERAEQWLIDTLNPALPNTPNRKTTTPTA